MSPCPQTNVAILTPSISDLGDRVNKVNVSSLGCMLIQQTGVLTKRGNGTHGHLCRGRTVKRHREKTTIGKPRQRPGADPSLIALGRGQSCCHLDFGPLAS